MDSFYFCSLGEGLLTQSSEIKETAAVHLVLWSCILLIWSCGSPSFSSGPVVLHPSHLVLWFSILLIWFYGSPSFSSGSMALNLSKRDLETFLNVSSFYNTSVWSSHLHLTLKNPERVKWTPGFGSLMVKVNFKVKNRSKLIRKNSWGDDVIKWAAVLNAEWPYCVLPFLGLQSTQCGRSFFRMHKNLCYRMKPIRNPARGEGRLSGASSVLPDIKSSYTVDAATGSNLGLSVLLKDTSTRAGIEPPTPWLKDTPAIHWPTVTLWSSEKRTREEDNGDSGPSAKRTREEDYGDWASNCQFLQKGAQSPSSSSSDMESYPDSTSLSQSSSLSESVTCPASSSNGTRGRNSKRPHTPAGSAWPTHASPRLPSAIRAIQLKSSSRRCMMSFIAAKREKLKP